MTSEPEERKPRSHSQLNEYAQCSERFRLKRVVRPRPPDRPAAWLAHGNAFHETYQEWELSGRADSFDFKARYSRRYDELIDQMRLEQPDLNLWLKPFRVRKVLEHVESQKIKGLEQVDTFLDMMEDNDDWWPYQDEDTTTPAVELPFTIMLGEVPIRGFIDFVREHSEGFSVLDFKTGNRQKSVTQLGLYKLVMEEEYGLKITHGEFFYTKDLHLTPPIDLSRYTREYLTEIYTALDKGAKEEVFIPNPGDHCGLCPVEKYCREMGSQPIPLDFASVPDPWWGVRESD